MSKAPETKLAAAAAPPVPAPATTPAKTSPLPPAPADTSTWEGQAAVYLQSRGWRRIGSNSRGSGVWTETPPEGDKAQLKEAGFLPASGGGQEVLLQWHGPPVPWTYSTEDALALQQERERTQESLQQTITRKQQELDRLLERATAGEK